MTPERTITTSQTITPIKDEHVIHATAYVKLAIQFLVMGALTGLVVFLIVVNRPVPDLLIGAWGTVVGYFFGANGVGKDGG